MQIYRTRRRLAAAIAVVLIGVGGAAAVAVASDSTKERPVFGIDPGPDGPVPEFVAVSDGRGGIAGYAEVALMDGTADMPSSPKEALAESAAPGVIIRVFDTDAKVVGYFASQPDRAADALPPAERARVGSDTDAKPQGGFVDAAGKDALVAEGWRYLEGTTPIPEP